MQHGDLGGEPAAPARGPADGNADPSGLAGPTVEQGDEAGLDRSSPLPGSLLGYERQLSEAEQVLDEVDRALARLEDGTYGTCEVCGEPVAEERLAADPLARTCESHPLLTDPR